MLSSYPRRASAVALFAAFMLAVPAQAADKLVTVTGEATIGVAPDMAMIRIGVTSLGRNAREASDANTKKMSAVLAAIKEAGIGERDVQTSRLTVQPQYDPNKAGPARLTGFQVTNQLTVRVRDVEKVAIVLDQAITAGANEMSGIEFLVSEQSKLLDQARDEAVADAKRKAGLYAEAAGGKLGKVVSITEEGSAGPIRPVAALRAGAIPVAPGEATLRATVSVSYELNQDGPDQKR